MCGVQSGSEEDSPQRMYVSDVSNIFTDHPHLGTCHSPGAGPNSRHLVTA